MRLSSQKRLSLLAFILLLLFPPPGFSQTGKDFLLTNAEIHAPDSVASQIQRFRISLQTAQILLRPPEEFYGDQPFAINLGTASDSVRKTLLPVFRKAVAAVDTLSFRTKNWNQFLASLARARRILKPVAAFAKTYTLYLDGNAHIDMAWLWRWRETVEVCRNTFRQQLNLMNEFPEYKYTQSTAQAFKWMENRYPGLFQNIQQRVSDKRWEMVGGMVVEADCDLIGGESWARQHLYGKRYFRKKFGVDIDLGWNPDSFGYNWNMPQFLRRSGIKAFLTQKISWNDTNVFPYHLFWWEAPDGSRVLTYFPFSGYVGDLNLKTLIRDLRLSEANTGRKDVLVLYGMGDHGGGPERSMLERVQMYQTATVFPRVRFSFARTYFDTLFASDLTQIPVWRDELYLEYHRGTYTTHGEIKRNNRKKEILLTNSEKLASISEVLGKHVYRQKVLNQAWWTYLFNQFHDILPGSSIAPVYKDAMADYAVVGKKAGKQLQAALQAISGMITTPSKGEPIVVFNTLSWKRDGLVRIPFKQNPGKIRVLDTSGKEILSQIVASPKDDTLLFVAKDIPPMGYRVFTLQKGRASQKKPGATARATSLENSFFRVTIDPKTGNISHIFDKRSRRNVLAAGEEGNRIQLFEDIPRDYDAWNIGYTGKMWELNHPDTLFVKEKGPVRAVIRIKKSFLGESKRRRYPTKTFPSSFFTQDITLYAGLPIVECRMKVDWWENHVLAKVAFPLSVKSRVATYGIPFATIQRPATRNNSWEKARFEVAAQFWGDISQKDYGVSLLNESKYGYDALKNTLRLTLLRSPMSPDPTADRGINRFSYALYPHKGTWRDGQTVLRGYEYNVPLLAIRISPHRGRLPETFSFFQVRPTTVILAAIKKAEDSQALIFRFFESQGVDTVATVTFFKAPRKITEVNLIEENLKSVPFSGKTLRFPISHNEIRSFKIDF
ncbi:MAG: alpha-mannosidase [Calditrichaeota bacterium]|nr:alpha-mannosidase [Calditrichota bacterium]